MAVVNHVLSRISALPTLNDRLPADPVAGSHLADDAERASFRTYDVIRQRLVDGIGAVVVAGQMSCDPTTSLLGTHLIALRPALLAAAKGWWVIEPHQRRTGKFSDPDVRISRALGLLVKDRDGGRSALEWANRLSGIREYATLAEKFAAAQASLRAEADRLGLAPVAPPQDGHLSRALGAAVDDYYGDGATSEKDAQLLWNISSGLAHGERWFPDLTRPSRGRTGGVDVAGAGPAEEGGSLNREVARLITERCLEVVCSGLTVLGLTLLDLASGSPQHRPDDG